jgi:hypothetical protein
MIKQFIVIMALLTIFLIPVRPGVFNVVRTTTDYVETQYDGPIPVQYTLGNFLYGDNFYKDFTK